MLEFNQSNKYINIILMFDIKISYGAIITRSHLLANDGLSICYNHKLYFSKLLIKGKLFKLCCHLIVIIIFFLM